MDYVLNEWILDWSLPTATEEQKAKVHQVIDYIKRKSGKIVVRYSRDKSPFVDKLFNYAKQTEEMRVFNWFFILMRDVSFTKLLYENEVQDLPEKLVNEIPEKHKSHFLNDQYLIETAYSTNNKTIITTDVDLKEIIDGKENIKVLLLEEFLGLNNN